MSSTGELYVTEQCRDFAQKRLDRMFGEGNWSLNGSAFYSLWDERAFPDIMEIEIQDRDGEKKLGTLFIGNEFKVEDDGYGKYISISPKKIVRITKI